MRTFKTLMGVCFLFCSTAQVFAQEKQETVTLKKDFEIQKHTVMERYEAEYVVSVEKRAEMKQKRIANAEHTLSVLDTIKISNRKRKLLLRDLKHNPFSDRLNKFIVETKFDDDNEDLVNQ